MSENNIKKFMLIILKIKEVLDVQDILVLSEKLPGWGDLSSFFLEFTQMDLPRHRLQYLPFN